uniref:Uncharacterized protein n=1 Tax=viral metagenome TaxID=1070528 RepID=A0A6C0J6C0_9ZZZZ
MNFTQNNWSNFTENVCFIKDENVYTSKDICQKDNYFEKFNIRNNMIIFYFIHLVIYYITIGITTMFIFNFIKKYFVNYLEKITRDMYEDFNIHYDDDERLKISLEDLQDSINKLNKSNTTNFIKDKNGLNKDINKVKMEMNESETKVYLQDENNNFNLIITKDIGTNTFKEQITPTWCESSEEYFRCRLEKLLENTRIAIPIDSFCSIYGDISQIIPKDQLFLEFDKYIDSTVPIICMLRDICCKRGWNDKFLITHND